MCGLMACLAGIGLAGADEVLSCSGLGPVWSGHQVGMSLLTCGRRQYAAFYDGERRLTVAARELDPEGGWQRVVLPSRLGWDSHNYVTMAMDDAGHLHVSGNMHASPLVYFRMSRPGDLSSLERVAAMTGKQESRVTYPIFLRGAGGEFIFTYRDGASGSGNQIYNLYDTATRTWRRLLDRPLTDGGGAMNAYLVGPQAGPDGWYHLCWVWRDTPSCDTNHDLSYARSRDLRHWETADGTPLELPLTIRTPGLVVDPSPVRGGLINMGICMGFDQERRVVITYHRYDADGHSQIYNARLEQGRWSVRQTSDWAWRWDFTGGGSIPCEARAWPLRWQDGRLTQRFAGRGGSGVWLLDPETLRAVATLPPQPDPTPAEVRRVRGAFPGLRLMTAGDAGRPDEPGVRYLMRWEALPANRDRPRPEPWPQPAELQVYKLRVSPARP